MGKHNEERVLIAAPIGDGKEYSINDWIQWIAKQDHDHYDAALCVNGKSEESIRTKTQLLKGIRWHDGRRERIPIILTHPYREYEGSIERITKSRENLREYAIRHDYDALFFLDTDTIPLNLGTIPDLLAHEVDCVSGLYFYKHSRQPVAIDQDTGTNFDHAVLEKHYNAHTLASAWGFGYGCLLLRGAALRVPFEYGVQKQRMSDDFAHCNALSEVGIARWLCPRCMCRHMSPKDYTNEANP